MLFPCASALVAVLLLQVPISFVATPQEPNQETRDNFFTGTVTDVSDSRIVVEKSVLGRTESRTFSLTSGTKIEGKLARDARVTVQFTSGDAAVYIIVRSEQKSSVVYP